MKMDRREFLRIAGLAGLGLGIGTGASGWILSRGIEASEFIPSPNALTAKRWAMVVVLSKFKTEEDYKRVIDACHRFHNVPDIGNPKDEVKWIWTDTYEHVFVGQENEYLPEEFKERPFPLLCNHCTKAPCVRVCPTKATFKRKDGITMQDYHRCIGCRFCMAACPYGARSFNWRDPRPFIKETNPSYPTRTKGVVEKCTYCVELLENGEMPKCVQASKGGLIFGDLMDPNSEVRKVLSENFSMRRKAEMGTGPSVFYIIGGGEEDV